MSSTGNAELDGFIAKYTPEIASLTHTLLARLRERIPGAKILVYDNYNALAIGFGANDKPKAAIVSLVPYPRWITLFLLHGAGLEDPHGLLQGSGSTVRSIRLTGVETLDDPRVEALIAEALDQAEPPIDPGGDGEIVIKSVSAKQRPRRPVGT